MVPFNVSNFVAQTKVLGHARPNMFEVYLSAPGIVDGVTAKAMSRIYARATEIPGVTINNIEIPHQGCKTYIPTQRQYNDWTVTLQNDTNYVLRNLIEKWQNAISNYSGIPDPNRSLSFGSIINIPFGKKKFNLKDIYCDLYVIHYSNFKIPRPTAVYRLGDAFPLDIAPHDVDWNNNDSVEEVTITFRYNYLQKLTTADLFSFLNNLGGNDV